MAVAFRAAGAVSKVASGNLTSVGLPAGHVLNDILLLMVAASDNVVCSVTGYTSILAVNNGTSTRFELWAKRDGGAESAPTVTHAAGNVTNAVIVGYSGVDTGLTVGTGAGKVFRDAQTQSGAGSTTTFTVTAPALTGVVSGDMRVFFGMYTVVLDTSGATTNQWSTVTGFTERVDASDETSGGNAVAEGVDDLLASGSAGSITSTATWNGGVAANWIGAQVALSSDASTAAGGNVLVSNIPFMSSGRL